MPQELPIKIEAFIYRMTDASLEYLLLKRVPEDGGFWQPVTGTLEFEESLRECILREISEETGIDSIISLTSEVHRFSWQKQDYTVVELVYGINVMATQTVSLSKEHDDYKWVHYEEAQNLLNKENNRIALTKLHHLLNP